VNNWQAIWNRRSSVDKEYTLEDLIKLDGFDSGAGAISPEDWLENCRYISNELKLKNGQSVYEVGCGADAFLKGLLESNQLRVGGLDYSEGLIETGKRAFPDGSFRRAEADQLDSAQKYDFVISNSVFHYLNPEYASNTLSLMLEKAEKDVAVLEVPDLAYKEDSERLRQDALSKEEYRKKYEGLEHTYFLRHWFKDIVNAERYECVIKDVMVPNYLQSKFIFNVFILPA